MIKVLHIYKTSHPSTFGGIETFIDQLASNSLKHGITSEVLSLSKKNVPSSTVIKEYLVHLERENFSIFSNSFSFTLLSKFIKLQADVDIIHYHFPWPFMDLLHFLAKVKKPTIVTYHSDIIRQRKLYKIYFPLMKLFLTDVTRIVATSENYINSSIPLQTFNDKVSIIPIGIGESSYPVISNANKLMWENILGRNYFLFIGVLRYYKGLHILLEAFKELNCNLVIIGEGFLEKELKKYAIENNINNVKFIGAVTELDKVSILNLCLSVVLPSNSRAEAFGISLVEGAMFGKPLISCNIGTGTSFINIHNETGLVVNPNDVYSLKNALIKIKNNPDLVAQFGNNARMRYEKLFTAEKMVQSYSNLYIELIDNN
jgi:glycosyltransferase involved in cell wall biosynthesis